VARTRYVEVDLRAPRLGVQEALKSAQDVLNATGKGGWAFGDTPSDFRMVIFREFETEKAFRQALAQLREHAGGRKYVREVLAPP
jgi:hypothetical protein